MIKYQIPQRRLALAGVVAALLAAPPMALADEQSARAELKSIRVLADQACADMVRRVAMVRLSLPPDASPLLRRELADTDARLSGCTAPDALLGAAALAGAAAVVPGAPGPGTVGKPALGVPAFGQAPARAPGLDEVNRSAARASSAASTPERAQRLRLLAASLAAVVAAAAAGTVFMMYRRAQDKSERLAILNRELNEHARRDPLTRLQNRRAFLDKMLDRSESMPINRTALDCITLLNIDHFRLVNERLGHDVGDAVLAEIGRRLKDVVRDTDMLVRWGGEEFLVFSPDAHPHQMRAMLERVLGAVGAKPVELDGQSVAVTISAGLASLPFGTMTEEEFDWQKVVSLADKALHYAKKQGRNRAAAITGVSADERIAMAAIEADFGVAVEQGMVELMLVPGPAGAKVTQLHPA